jgi:outer membrane protein assembly factor BamB
MPCSHISEHLLPHRNTGFVPAGMVLFFLLPLLCGTLSAQTPRINWWFDTHDSSFGQTAAGDIDGDGKLELVFGCYRNDSCVYALNAEDGSLLWKYNTHSPGAEGCNDVAPVIYDVDGDGHPEVILPSSCNPTTFCFDGKTGAVKWRTPTKGSDSPPSIADVDGDGKAEILHGEFGGYVICINAEDGSVAWEIPVDTHSWIQTAPTLADLDGDGRLDFVVATWNKTAGDTNKVYAFRGIDHSLLWTYPLTDVVYHGTAVADLDHDGKPELVIGDYSGLLTVLNGEDGSVAWTYRYDASYYIGSPASIADINGDGDCEVIITSWYKVIALTHDGHVLWDYSINGYPSAFRGVALSDIDNDAKPDVLFGTNNGLAIALKGTTGDTLWTMDLAARYGNTAFDINHAPVIADFDGDGTLDMFLVGGHSEYPDFSKNFGRGYCLSIGRGAGPDWLMFQKNLFRNSSLCAGPSSGADVINSSAPIAAKLFPNPARNLVSIAAPDMRRIQIMDFLGRIVKQIDVSGESTHVDVSDLPRGIYLMKIMNDKTMMTQKIVKE